MKDLKPINVPMHDEYRIEDEYKAALKRIPEFKQYFPHYEDQKNYLPPRTYFWEVYHSVLPAHVEGIVDRINASVKFSTKEQPMVTI